MSYSIFNCLYFSRWRILWRLGPWTNICRPNWSRFNHCRAFRCYYCSTVLLHTTEGVKSKTIHLTDVQIHILNCDLCQTLETIKLSLIWDYMTSHRIPEHNANSLFTLNEYLMDSFCQTLLPKHCNSDPVWIFSCQLFFFLNHLIIMMHFNNELCTIKWSCFKCAQNML